MKRSSLSLDGADEINEQVRPCKIDLTYAFEVEDHVFLPGPHAAQFFDLCLDMFCLSEIERSIKAHCYNLGAFGNFVHVCIAKLAPP